MQTSCRQEAGLRATPYITQALQWGDVSLDFEKRE